MKRNSIFVVALLAASFVFATALKIANGWNTFLLWDYITAWRYTGIYALWPSLLLSRLGLQHSWILIPAALGLGWFIIRNSRWALESPRKGQARLILCITLGILGYLSLGVVYVHLFPVPHPVVTGLDLENDTEQNVRHYLSAYEEAYRWGIAGGGFLNYNGVFSDATRQGWLDGNLLGAAEWQRVFPGVFSSKVEGVANARRQRTAEESSENQKP